MRSIVLDSSCIISLSNSCALDILEFLKEKSGVCFYLTPWVKEEVVDAPLRTKRFKLAGLRVMELLKEGVMEVYGSTQMRNEAVSLLNRINHVFYTRKFPVRIVHKGEVETFVAAERLGTRVIGMDEHVFRLFLEDVETLKMVLRKRLRKEVKVNQSLLREIWSEYSKKSVIRSTELASVAFHLGYFDPFREVIQRGKAEALRGILWSLKLNGCAISTREIEEYVRVLVGR